MAPLPPVDGVCKLTFSQSCSGRTFGSKIYILNGLAEPWTLADLNTIANAMATSWQTRIAPFQDPPLILNGTIAQDLSSAMGLEAQHIANTAGTFPGADMLPLNCQARCTFPTVFRYRGGRPGFNITGLDRQNLADERSIKPTTVTSLIASVFAMLLTDVPAVTLTTGHPTAVNVSYFSGHVERTIPLVTLVTTVEVQNRVCTLRKRLGKGEAG